MGERWPTHGGSSPAARPACNSGASLSSAAAKWASSTGPVFTQDGTQHFVRYRPGFAVAAGPRIEDQGWAARPRRVGKGLPAAQRGRQISQLRYVRHGRRGLGVVSGRWTARIRLDKKSRVLLVVLEYYVHPDDLKTCIYKALSCAASPAEQI